MSRKPKFDPRKHDDNPTWTDAEIARSRPAAEMPPEILAQFKNKGGRPKLDQPKEAIKIRVDSSVLKTFRSTGSGWQTRMNDILKRAAKRIDKERPQEPQKRRA